MHIIILMTIHAVNSIIVFTCINFNSIILSHIIRNKRKTTEKKHIKIETLINIGTVSRNAKRLIDKPKKVKMDAIDRFIA
ncbi:MAG: hypothetical protein ACFFCL_09315 [Promethearchaeota archaeon]